MGNLSLHYLDPLERLDNTTFIEYSCHIPSCSGITFNRYAQNNLKFQNDLKVFGAIKQKGLNRIPK
jgi:hypothetical protein